MDHTVWSWFLCSSSHKYSCFEQNLSEEDFLSECKESKSVSLSFGSLVLYARKGSWFLAALRKRQVFGFLQFFIGGQWYSVLCEQENFITQNNLGKIEIKGSFKADDVSVKK
ncbi:hypothetical protein C1646_742389 [Rhizophagus diaphanus]|nr:hypothetical protein C1646_742389 [Rhizophagus diaphanus] [Rhizophagus sp. MUCL 43196]